MESASFALQVVKLRLRPLGERNNLRPRRRLVQHAGFPGDGTEAQGVFNVTALEIFGAKGK